MVLLQPENSDNEIDKNYKKNEDERKARTDTDVCIKENKYDQHFKINPIHDKDNSHSLKYINIPTQMALGNICQIHIRDRFYVKFKKPFPFRIKIHLFDFLF